jgi:MSHA pilin protein MshD
MIRPYSARGATLVELILFIVIVGIVVAGLVTAFASTLRGVGVPKHITQALELAQGRMELIVAQKHRLGFAAFDGSTYDPCLTGTAGNAETCFVPAAQGFAVTTSITLDWNGNANYKVPRVTVTGPDTNITVETLVASY